MGECRYIRRLWLGSLVSLGVAALAGCGEEPGAAITEVPDSPVITALAAELDPATIAAGGATTVTCRATYSDAREAVVDDARIEVEPATQVSVDGPAVTAAAAGRYAVFCRLDGVDTSSPATLVVQAGLPERVIATVTPTTARAGDPVTARCETEDDFGNRAPAPSATVRASPSRDVTVDGQTLVFERVGAYEVECRQDQLERVPAQVTVNPGAPARLVAEATPRSPRAGEPVVVTCHAVDAFANPVRVDAEVRVSPAPTTLDAGGFTAEVAGDYEVTCAAPGASAEALPVVVQPNLPASLEILGLDPDKPIYASGEAVVPEVRVTDVYGNLIERPRVVYRGLPAGSVTDLGRQAVLLGDGRITVVAAAEPPTHMDQPVEGTRDVVVDGLPPEVTVTFPARGEMVARDPSQSLTIRGTVSDQVSAVTDFVVNGRPVTPDASGAFSATMSPDWGTNLIEISAVDAAGNVRQLAQSFHLASRYRRVSPSRTVSGRTPDGLVAHLGQAALDDDSGDVDDLATIARLAIQNANVAALIPDPATTYNSDCWLATGRLRLHVDGVRFGTPSIDIESRSGGLYAYVSIPNVVVDVRTSGDVCNIGVRVSGSATASRITASGFLSVSTQNGRASVSMASPSVNIQGLRINLSLPAVIDWAVDGIINLFRGAISNRLESAFRDVLRGQIPPVIEDFLDAFELSTGFDLPAPLSTRLSIASDLGSLTFDSRGGRIGLDAAVYAAPARSPEPRGGILQQSRGLPSFGTRHSLGVALSYDLLNQALYSAWYGGALDLDLAPFFAGELDSGGQTLNVGALATPLLPPIVKPSGDPAYPVEIQLGDLGVDLDITGIPNLPNVQSTIYAHATLRANVTVTPAGAIQLSIAPNPTVTLDVQSSLDVIVDPAALRAALETIINAYLPQVVGDVIGGIPLPTFDLSSIAGGFLPPNIVLGLGGAQTRFHPSYLILEGNLVPVP